MKKIHAKKFVLIVITFVITTLLITSFINRLVVREKITSKIQSINGLKNFQGLVLDSSGLGSLLLSYIEYNEYFYVETISVKSLLGGQKYKDNFNKSEWSYRNYYFNSLTVDYKDNLVHYQIAVVINLKFYICLLVALVPFASVICFILLTLTNLRDERVASAKVWAMSRQLAHDIRSPLAALDVALKDDQSLPEEKRRIIRSASNRIHEIANELLLKNKLKKQKDEDKQIMLISIIESIVLEKRMQFKGKKSLEIESNFHETSYGLFTNLFAGDLNRVLSNIINNAIEAVPENTGKVSIYLFTSDKNSLIKVVDNGKGMSPETLKSLGRVGFSYGKENTTSGSGLGFYHAKKTIESFGGEIKVESKVGVGTTVSIYLPLAEPPKTFVKNITVKKGDIVAIVDDDQSIHQVWESKLAGVKMEHFNSTLNVKSNADLFLVDYEFLGEEKSGLDFIEENNLASKAILVTSRYEDPEIQERCERQNIKLLSKGLVPYVSVVIEKDFDTILIDDDELVRMVWDSKAKEKGVEFKSYADPSEANFEGLNKEACIYIDSNLANGLKGEELAQKLFNEGFQNIYMATGYNPEDFKHLTFLKGVIGKSPPWA